MAESDPPRFFKVFISRFYSDSLHIPISYYDQLPHPLPTSAILQGNGGCIWKVLMKEMQDEVHFTQGWSKFVEDNSLVDGDFMTFVYNGDCVFEVSVYDGRTACKVIRAVDTEAQDDKDDDIYTLSSSSSKDTDSASESETRANVILRSKNKGSKDSVSDNPDSSEPKTKRGKVAPRIKDPERFLADPKNIHFETILKNRKHELLVHAQIVRDYELKFEPSIHYIDNHKDGKLQAKAIKWADQRVCIKKWKRICERNKVKEKDAILCELFRKRRTVYAVRIHIVREKDL